MLSFVIRHSAWPIRLALLLLGGLALFIGTTDLYQGRQAYGPFRGRYGVVVGSPILAILFGLAVLYFVLFHWEEIRSKIPGVKDGRLR